MKRPVLACAFVTGMLSVVAAAAEQPSRADIDALVAPYVGKSAPGIAVLVMRKGQVLHMKGYGYADIEARIPVDESTVFDLASVSKQMTDLALMLLIKDGAVRADTPVREILPAFEAQQTGHRPIVVSDLVHHVSGLPDYDADDNGIDYKTETTNDEVIAWLVRQELERPPGTAFEYSNSGYVVLARVVAARAGKGSLAEVLKQRVFGPLGMHGTGVVIPAVDPEHVAKGYAGTGGNFTASSWPYVIEGDGGVMTSVRDLALYETALAANTLLDADATRALCTSGTMDDGSPVRTPDGAGYGFGWFIETQDGNDYCWHDGSWLGTATAYVRNLTTRVSVIVLANGEDMWAAELADAIDKAVR